MNKKNFIFILYLTFLILLYPQAKKEEVLVPQRIIYIKNQANSIYVKFINEEIFRNCEILDSEKNIRFIKDYNTEGINIKEIKKEETQKIYLNSNIRGIIYADINESGNILVITLNFLKTFNNELNTVKVEISKSDFFNRSNELSGKIILLIKNNFQLISPTVIKKEKTESYKILRDAPARQFILSGCTGFNGISGKTKYSFIYPDTNDDGVITNFNKGVLLGFNFKIKLNAFYLGGKTNFSFLIDDKKFLFDAMVPVWDLGGYFIGDLLRISNFTYIQFSRINKGIEVLNLLWAKSLLCFEIFPVRQVGFSINLGAGSYIFIKNPYNDRLTDSAVAIIVNQTSTFYLYKNIFMDLEINFEAAIIQEEGPQLNYKFLLGFGYRIERK